MNNNMASKKKVIDLVTSTLSESSDDDTVTPPMIKRCQKLWQYKDVELLESSGDEKKPSSKPKSKDHNELQSQPNLKQKSKPKPYIPSNPNISSPFPVGNAAFATPTHSYASSNRSVTTSSAVTKMFSSSSTSSTGLKRRSEKRDL